MTKIMKENTRKLGSFTLLTGLGATLVAGALAWLFSTTIENKVTFAPLTQAVNNLNDTVNASNVLNAKEHLMIVNKLAEMTNKVIANDILLRRVIEDCDENGNHIDRCRINHNGKGEHYEHSHLEKDE